MAYCRCSLFIPAENLQIELIIQLKPALRNVLVEGRIRIPAREATDLIHFKANLVSFTWIMETSFTQRIMQVKLGAQWDSRSVLFTLIHRKLNFLYTRLRLHSLHNLDLFSQFTIPSVEWKLKDLVANTSWISSQLLVVYIFHNKEATSPSK